MEECLAKYPVVSVDSEFPGFLVQTPRDASEEVRFKNLKHNVGATSLIQLGLTLSNSKGTVAGIWQFNFQFDLKRDLYCQKSIDFLIEHGIDFEKLKNHGVDRVEFGLAFGRVIRRRQSRITWVSFHGVYDYAHIVKAVTFRPVVAESSAEFVDVLGNGFDSVVDVKYMARFYKETGSEIGLQKLADNLDVKRRGEAHTAASDSLLTALVYIKLKKKLKLQRIEEDDYVDFVYGISTRISRPISNQMVVTDHHYQGKMVYAGSAYDAGGFGAEMVLNSPAPLDQHFINDSDKTDDWHAFIPNYWGKYVFFVACLIFVLLTLLFN
ncbi:Probable CCR4-associated factor 1 homolog 1 [Linum grandiflorum]